jgi:hypothetical protein
VKVITAPTPQGVLQRRRRFCAKFA